MESGSLPFPAEYLPLAYAVVILWGVVDCFLGFRVFKFTLAFLLGLAGAAAGAWLGLELTGGSVAWLIGGAATGLLLGVILSFTLFQAAVAVGGAFFAFALVSPHVASLAPELQAGILIVAGLLAGVVATMMVAISIKLSTALTGAFRIVYGGWYFAGGPAILELVWAPEVGLSILARSQTLFLVTLGVAAIGFTVQMLSDPRKGRTLQPQTTD